MLPENFEFPVKISTNCKFFQFDSISGILSATSIYIIIIINSHVRNSVDETTLDRVAFLRELIMIRDSSLTLSGLLSCDELNDIISHVCTS